MTHCCLSLGSSNSFVILSQPLVVNLDVEGLKITKYRGCFVPKASQSYVHPACHNRTHKAQALMGECLMPKGTLVGRTPRVHAECRYVIRWNENRRLSPYMKVHNLFLTVKGISIGVDDCGSLLI